MCLRQQKWCVSDASVARDVVCDRAHGDGNPSVRWRPHTVSASAVGGVGRTQHAQMCYTYHTRQPCPGEYSMLHLNMARITDVAL